MNFEFSIGIKKHRGMTKNLFLLLTVALPLLLVSCSKNPRQFQEEGMKAYVAGDYAKAQDFFADGIKKEGSRELYAGFIAANLVTGRYPQINAAYNTLCDDIHASLVNLYGKRSVQALGVTSGLTPYKIAGGNQVPSDYPQTIMLQENADFSGYLTIKGQIDSILRK